VWLYRGEIEKYRNLLDEYKKYIDLACEDVTQIALELVEQIEDNFFFDFLDAVGKLNLVNGNMTDIKDGFQNLIVTIDEQIASWEIFVDSLEKNLKKKLYDSHELSSMAQYKKKIIANIDTFKAIIKAICNVVYEYEWLTEKFGEGRYQDVLGLCKLADRAEIAEKGYSLTPGAYVGVAAVEDDGVDFAARMAEIHNELLTLQAESNELMETISRNMKEMGL
jgi:type I restriction enzyme M protein